MRRLSDVLIDVFRRRGLGLFMYIEVFVVNIDPILNRRRLAILAVVGRVGGY